MTPTKENLERVGPAYDAEKLLHVRKLTRDTVNEIAARVRPGMVEENAVEMAKDLLAQQGMLRGWHDVYVRFGSNTTKTFGAPSDPGVVLQENDICFVDIGPVWEKWEGDAGDTFVIGDDAGMKRCAEDVRSLFHIVRRKWLADGASGKELYAYAEQQARELGWALNLDLSGHRIADFPHTLIYEGPLAETDFHPSRLIWVLEIHIRHPTKNYGAFFEDMLLEDKYF